MGPRRRSYSAPRPVSGRISKRGARGGSLAVITFLCFFSLPIQLCPRCHFGGTHSPKMCKICRCAVPTDRLAVWEDSEPRLELGGEEAGQHQGAGAGAQQEEGGLRRWRHLRRKLSIQRWTLLWQSGRSLECCTRIKIKIETFFLLTPPHIFWVRWTRFKTLKDYGNGWRIHSSGILATSFRSSKENTIYCVHNQ